MQYFPSPWSRGTIAIRINSLVKGYSAIRPVVIERLENLLAYHISRTIPLRGILSASGDLSPLGYVAGTILGKPTIRTIARNGRQLYADEALRDAQLEPIRLVAKEGLALVNGTAASTAVGALALWDMHNLALVAQAMTAMAVEALNGTSESFHPFFAESRPHPGQVGPGRSYLCDRMAEAAADGKREKYPRLPRRFEACTGPGRERRIPPPRQILHQDGGPVARPSPGRSCACTSAGHHRMQLRH